MNMGARRLSYDFQNVDQLMLYMYQYDLLRYRIAESIEKLWYLRVNLRVFVHQHTILLGCFIYFILGARTWPLLL